MYPVSPSSDIKVLFIAGFGPIVRDKNESAELYRQVFGIAFKEENGGYLHTEDLKGAKTFALWPLSLAAQSCFGTPDWPADTPVPQAWLEFDVEDISHATTVLRAQGYELLVTERLEPWGQTVTRMLSPEGLLVGVTHTPSLR
jgi:catechol 2,3-dioxygenase-like lactoylglutathione lyase family enzyme